MCGVAPQWTLEHSLIRNQGQETFVLTVNRPPCRYTRKCADIFNAQVKANSG